MLAHISFHVTRKIIINNHDECDSFINSSSKFHSTSRAQQSRAHKSRSWIFASLRIDTYPRWSADRHLPAISNDNYKLMEAMLARPIRAAVARCGLAVLHSVFKLTDRSGRVHLAHYANAAKTRKSFLQNQLRRRRDTTAPARS